MPKNGDAQHLLKELFDTHHKAVYRFMLRQTGGVEQDAFDLVQETFLAAAQSLDRLADRGKARGWLFGIARNKSIDYLRKKCRTKAKMNDSFDVTAAASTAETPFEQFCRKERMTILAEISNEIDNPDIRQTVELYYSGTGCSFEEVAQKMGISRNTVSTRIGRIVRSIKRKLLRRIVDHESGL